MTTQSMIEKMARAAVEVDIAEDVSPELRETLLRISVPRMMNNMRAALQALREPTPETIAMYEKYIQANGGGLWADGSLITGVVDAILQEKA